MFCCRFYLRSPVGRIDSILAWRSSIRWSFKWIKCSNRDTFAFKIWKRQRKIVRASMNKDFLSKCASLWSLDGLFVLVLYTPVNNFAVMLGQFPIFLDWTDTKQQIKCLVQEHNTVTLPVVSLKLKLISLPKCVLKRTVSMRRLIETVLLSPQTMWNINTLCSKCLFILT